ncbi:MAG: ABC transporter transmembrane domain-containing protein, partial [Pseudomonadota bacterium]
MSQLEERPPSADLGPLRGLLPYLLPYKWLIALATVALVLTAALSLTLPLAVSQVIDGFVVEDAARMDRYFIAAIVIAGLLAIGTGLRYYFVTRLGERVVADIRIAVY